MGCLVAAQTHRSTGEPQENHSDQIQVLLAFGCLKGSSGQGCRSLTGQFLDVRQSRMHLIMVATVIQIVTILNLGPNYLDLIYTVRYSIANREAISIRFEHPDMQTIIL